MKRNLAESMGILLFSVCLALITNHFRADGLPLVRPVPSSASFLPPNSPLGGALSLETFHQKLSQSGVLILDARSSEEFWKGHIPGAKNLPYDEFAEASSYALEGIPFDGEIITYCEGINCANAEDLASLLEEMGYKDVKVFSGGWEEWIKNGMPVEEGRKLD